VLSIVVMRKGRGLGLEHGVSHGKEEEEMETQNHDPLRQSKGAAWRDSASGPWLLTFLPLVKLTPPPTPLLLFFLLLLPVFA